MTWDLRADVVVVGAGPAGGMAALELARQGIGVLLADRAPFPREKVCGDMLLEEPIGILKEAGLGEVLRREAHRIDRLRFCAPNGGEFVLEGGFATFRRRELDALIVETACRSGAQFLDTLRVEKPLVQDQTCVGVKGTDRSGRNVTVAAQVVLLATGANAKVLAAFGVLKEKAPSAYGVRGYFRLPELGDERAAIVVYDRSLLPLYAWFFPMGGGIFNVGWGVLPDRHGRVAPQINRLAALCRSRQVASLLAGARQEAPIRAAPMRTGLRGARACSGGLLVLGEALGLTFPFLGEGISNALVSGRLAARVVAKALTTGNVSGEFLAVYEQELRCLLHDRHLGYLAAERWFRHPRVANLLISRAAGSYELNRLIGEILRGRRGSRAIFSLRGMLRVLLRRYGGPLQPGEWGTTKDRK